jgi:hypothetical protein
MWEVFETCVKFLLVTVTAVVVNTLMCSMYRTVLFGFYNGKQSDLTNTKEHDSFIDVEHQDIRTLRCINHPVQSHIIDALKLGVELGRIKHVYREWSTPYIRFTDNNDKQYRVLIQEVYEPA